MLDWNSPALLLVAAAGVVGGAINSIAGGGTLATFPSLIALGVPPIVANASNTVALWPGALTSMWAYRGVLSGTRAWAVRLTIPSLIGGAVGAWLLLHTSPGRFSQIVPFLVLGATLLFLLQRPLMAWLGRTRHPVGDGTNAQDELPGNPSLAVMGYQFLVATYGGYFGAGIGILMLAALGFMGFTHIHRMNGLKNWFSLCVNLIATVTFAFNDVVSWPVAVAMAVGAMIGGYGGARLAQRVSQQRVRQAIIAIGFASGIWLFFR